ncbi:hypothetical protein ACJX0J_031081, partial [Zea mays]
DEKTKNSDDFHLQSKHIDGYRFEEEQLLLASLHNQDGSRSTTITNSNRERGLLEPINLFEENGFNDSSVANIFSGSQTSALSGDGVWFLFASS